MVAKCIRLASCAGILLMTARTCFAQAEVTGRIEGTVTDTSRAALVDAIVKAESPSLFAPKSILTGSDGAYFIDKLPPGTYRLTVTARGFKTMVRDGISVTANFTAKIPLALEIGAVQETINVDEAAPAVDVRTATSSTTFDSNLLKEIPSGRDTWSTLGQVPGLAPSKFDVGGSESYQQTSMQVHGSASGQQVYAVNGLNLNYPGGNGGSTAFYFDNEGFEEVQVTTDAAQAENIAGGVQINMITHQGSNNIHGSVSAYYTTHALTSAPTYPVFNGQTVVGGTTVTMMRDTNVQMGAPIVKNRIWLYGGYRRYDINLGVPAVKRPDGTAPKDDNHQGNVTGRLDLALTSKQKLSVNWLYNDINRFYRRGTGLVEDVAAGLQLEHAWVGQAQWTYTPTPTVTLESRFGNMTLHFPLDYEPGVTPNTVSVTDTVLGTLRYAKSGGASLSYTYHSRWSQNVSYYKGKFLGGAHNVRAGAEYALEAVGNKVVVNRDLDVQLANGAPLAAILYNSPVNSKARQNETAAYIQDSYMLGRFTFNIGLRYDRFISFLPAQTSPAGSFTGARSYLASKNIVDWNDFSPRVAVTFDPTGKGTKVVRASYSRFVLLQGSSLATAVNPNALSSTTVTFTSLGPDNYPLGLSTTPVFQDGGAFTHIDPNLTRPRSKQATVGYEQQIFGDVRVSVGYYYRNTSNIISRVNRAALPTDYSPITVTNPITGAPFTIYNLAKSKVGQSDFLISNIPSLSDNAYHGLEFSASKRLHRNWQLLGGFTVQRKKGTYNTGTSDDLNNPNLDIDRRDAVLDLDSTYMFKLSGSYKLPKGLTASLNFQHYTGYPYLPTMLYRNGVDASGSTVPLNQNSVTVALAVPGEKRLDAVNLMNLRFGYEKNIGERFKLKPALDLYNIANSNTVTAVIATYGPNYLKPSTILGQRLVKFGMRVDF